MVWIGSVLALQHPEWGPEPPVAPYGMAALPSGRVVLPMVFPLIGPYIYRGGYGTVRSGFLHTGMDIRAEKMTPIVAPISGILGMKAMTFWIYSLDGWVVLGTHLNDDNFGKHDHKGDRDMMFAPNLSPGDRVKAGEFLGYVGESGDATAPHLHFEVYAPGRGKIMTRIRDPLPSLNAARKITAPVSTLPDGSVVPGKGLVRLVGCVRRVDPGAGTVTLLLTDTLRSDGIDRVVTSVRYRRVRVSLRELGSLGGWGGLSRLGRAQRVSVVVPDSGGTANAVAVQVFLTDRS